jgi:hypothetical protein
MQSLESYFLLLPHNTEVEEQASSEKPKKKARIT